MCSAHIAEPVSLTELAAVAGLSRMHFAAQFRAATGCSPHTYLLNRRIEEAKTLMATTTMPLAEVALAVGFQAQCHFSTVFKRFTGETPATWRTARRDRARASRHLAPLSLTPSRRRSEPGQPARRPRRFPTL